MGLFELILGVVGLLLTIAALLGIFFVRFKNSADDERLAVWKGEAEAYKDKAERLEAEMKELTLRVTKCEHENELLREMVTGKKAIEDLRVDVNTGFSELKALLTEREG